LVYKCNNSEINALRFHLFPALFTKAKSFMRGLIALFEDSDQKTSPLWEILAGFFEDCGMALDVFGG